MILDKLNELKQKALQNITESKDLKALDDIRVSFLGKKGEITELLKTLGTLSKEERPKFGQLVNEVKNFIEQKINEELVHLKQIELDKKLNSEKIDVTLPGRQYKRGAKHPVKKILDQMEDIFLGMGFSIANGPEIETDFYNFKAMNFQDDHPARDAQDTFYIDRKTLFRTHTSPVQARTMQLNAPNPIRVICPGRVFRRDDIDATHHVQFHQVEGLLVDKDVKLSDLTGILLEFVRKMFGDDMKIRLRPSFFPFTEPSAEVDVSCIFCRGKGCGFCKQSGWIEVLGSGCVHPNVLKYGGYDPEVFSGWAFGIGVERIALLKYGINDIRLLTDNDVRFLEQFK